MTFAANKRAMIEKRLAELKEEWDAVYGQIGRELNEATKIRLQRQADEIEREITNLEAQLRQPETSTEPALAAPPDETGSQGSGSQYIINISGGQGIVIGDQPQVTQTFAGSGGKALPSGTAVPPIDTARLIALTDQINRYFNLSEVRDLCFRLGIEYEDLGGEGRSEKVREMVRLAERNGRLPELIALLQQLRPRVAWE